MTTTRYPIHTHPIYLYDQDCTLCLMVEAVQNGMRYEDVQAMWNGIQV